MKDIINILLFRSRDKYLSSEDLFVIGASVWLAILATSACLILSICLNLEK